MYRGYKMMKVLPNFVACKDPSHFLFSGFVYSCLLDLFHLLLPYNLDVPSYLTNRQRYCSAWPERDWILYIFLNNLFLSLGEICCLNSFYLCIGWMEAPSFNSFLTAPIC